jgi:protein-tyrosine phosphatase
VAADGVIELGRALEVIAAPDSTPVVVHCTSGKDRTGLVIALVLSLLGVSDDDVVADFALTGLLTDRLRAAWEARHPDRELTWPGYGQAPPELMRRVLDELERQYGPLRDYARNQLGASDELLQALNDRLLVARAPQPPGGRRIIRS